MTKLFIKILKFSILVGVVWFYLKQLNKGLSL